MWPMHPAPSYVYRKYNPELVGKVWPTNTMVGRELPTNPTRYMVGKFGHTAPIMPLVNLSKESSIPDSLILPHMEPKIKREIK